MTVPVNITMNRIEGGTGNRVELRVQQHNHPLRLLRAYLSLETFASLVLGRNVRVDAEVAELSAPPCSWRYIRQGLESWSPGCGGPSFQDLPASYRFCPSCGGRIEVGGQGK